MYKIIVMRTVYINHNYLTCSDFVPIFAIYFPLCCSRKNVIKLKSCEIRTQIPKIDGDHEDIKTTYVEPTRLRL